jgi:flotillin
MVWYHVAEPNSYLVVTGVGIEKVLIKKKVLKLSLQPFYNPY